MRIRLVMEQVPNLKELLDTTYSEGHMVPWDTIEPPAELVQLIESGLLKPCKVLDLGCGNGRYSVYLARQGFDVVGIDVSSNAISNAKKYAAEQGVVVDFHALDARDISKISGTFDFVFEWGLLHFVLPVDREKYISDLAQKINTGGMYMALTFSDQSPEWGGEKYRVGFTGAKLYYSSLEELEKLYLPYFEIIEKKIRPIEFRNSGKKHLENYFLMRRK